MNICIKRFNARDENETSITQYYTNTKKAKPTVTVGFACIFMV